MLLQVANPVAKYGPYLAQNPSLTQAVLEEELEKARIYLNNVRHAGDAPGIPTETESVPGLSAQTILAYSQLYKADLIVMCSHGYTGFKRWALGSVAQKVACNSPVPLLLLREGDSEPVNLRSDAAHPLRAL